MRLSEIRSGRLGPDATVNDKLESLQYQGLKTHFQAAPCRAIIGMHFAPVILCTAHGNGGASWQSQSPSL